MRADFVLRPSCATVSNMEMSREQAIDLLAQWKHTGITVGIYFAASGGTVVTTMLAQISHVSSRIVLTTGSGLLRFALYRARFEYSPLTVLQIPASEGVSHIDGLHIWLESGHWLFVCDVKGQGARWLRASAQALGQGSSEGSLPTEEELESTLRG